MHRFILIAIFAIQLPSGLPAQDVRDEKWKKDSGNVNITLFEDNKDGSVYTGMYEILKGIQPITFVGAAAYKGINRPYKLIDGEGKGGYLFEVNMDQVFTLLQGRNGSNHFWQRGRLAFRYAPAFRMANDSSLPLIPANQKAGLEFSFAIWNNYTNRKILDSDFLYYAKEQSWIKNKETFKVLHLIFHAMHYSNGQPPGVYYRTTPVLRNDYKRGDFSTNFLSLMGVYSVYTKEHRLYSGGLGYRIDGEVGGALSYIDAQIQRYGYHRLLGLLQYRSKPISFGKEILWTDLKTGRQYALKNKISIRHRVEAEYILGNLSNYDRPKQFRLGLHYYAELDIAKSRTAGIVFHWYRGRDYLNIRYDDVVSGGNLGISFNLMKYHPPRLKSSDFINRPVIIQYDKEKRKDEIVK
jgi:hypothetical protein